MESEAQSLVGNVVQLLGAEYRLLRGVGGEVAELRDELATMNALLRMQSEADEGAVDHFIREWMKQLRELAYDSEDSVDHYKLRIKCRSRGDMRAWLNHQFQTVFLRRRLAGEIRALRARANNISERHARYGVNREALRRSPSVLASSASALALCRANDNAHQFVGIGDQANNMAKLVKAPVENERYLKVFSVVGFGGVGKTTLATKVCRRLVAEFPYQAMVSVSQAFEPTRDLKALLMRVLQQIVKPKTDNERGVREEGGLDGIDGLNEEGLAGKLEEYLVDKRYLIVIDDVWSIRAWEAIQSKLPQNNCDSRLIVTTRMETVARTCSPPTVSGDRIHRMKPLEPEDSKKLFLSRAFGSVDASYPVELGDIMDSILKKCGGIPLAIVSIASVLAGYKSSGSKEKWETIYKSIGSQMESNSSLEGMKQIVTLSFKHLPHELKGCMMYLSIFPEDYEIEKYRLLSRWIAEGLVPEKRGLTLREVAESYLEELLSRYMVEPADFEADGRLRSCRMHDFRLEVMVSKSLEANFVSLQGGQYDGMSYDRIRRLSIHGDLDGGPRTERGQAGRRGAEEVNARHVRSLSMFQQVEGHNKLLDQLGKFTLLRVLDLQDCKGVTDKHVRYACQLRLLRFLNLRGTDIGVVPPQVGKLEHLQTFDVRGTNVKELPETVSNLEKLEHIGFSNKTAWFHMWSLPRGLKKMKALRDVNLARLVNDVQVARELCELQQLQDICIYTEFDGDYEDVLEELALSLGKLYSLRVLNIAEMGGQMMHFLHNLPAPPRLLRSLRIEGELNAGLPIWVASLTYLTEFAVMRTRLTGDNLLDSLCELPNLKSIGLDTDFYIDHELVARTRHNFPVLRRVVACGDGTPPEVLRFEQGSMANLEILHVRFNRADRNIVGIEHLTNLKVVELKGKKDNPALHRELDKVKAENSRRHESNQIQVVVKYE